MVEQRGDPSAHLDLHRCDRSARVGDRHVWHLHRRGPELIVDGEVFGNTSVDLVTAEAALEARQERRLVAAELEEMNAREEF
jgi:hypothetical protein